MIVTKLLLPIQDIVIFSFNTLPCSFREQRERFQTLNDNLSYAGKFLQIVTLTKIKKANFLTKGWVENKSLGCKQEFVLESQCWEFCSDTACIAIVVVIDFVIES